MLAALTTASRSKCSLCDDLADRLAAASMRWGSELELNAGGSRTAFRQEHAPAIEPRGRLLSSSDDHRPALLLRRPSNRVGQPRSASQRTIAFAQGRERTWPPTQRPALLPPSVGAA